MNINKVHELEAMLSDILSSELSQIIQYTTAEPGGNRSPFIQIPRPEDVDLNSEELASMVARTSNAYVRVARLAGMARAAAKLAEGKYKKAYKEALSTSAKNAQEREAQAMKAASEEYTTFTLLEAIVELAESMEAAARIASESSRKLYDKSYTLKIGSAREEHGTFKDSDYSR